MILGYMLYSLITADPQLSFSTTSSPNQDAVPSEIIIYPKLDNPQGIDGCNQHIRVENGKAIDACIPVYGLKTHESTVMEKIKEKACN